MRVRDVASSKKLSFIEVVDLALCVSALSVPSLPARSVSTSPRRWR